MDRYISREQVQAVRQPRQGAAFSGLGQGLADAGQVFQSIAEADHKAFMAERGAAAQGALLDINRELEDEIASGSLLDFDSLDTEISSRFDERLGNLEISPEVMKRYSPQINYLKSQFSSGLKTKIANKRLEVEAAGINESLGKMTRDAIDANFDQEVLNYKGIIESTIDDLPDQLFPADRKVALKQQTWDSVIQQRTLRALDDPTIDPQIVKNQVNTAKAQISPEMYTDLSKRVQSAIEAERRDDILFSALDAIDMIEQNGGDTATVRSQLENSREVLGPQLFNALRDQVTRVEERKRGESAEAVLDEVRNLSALYGNYDGAAAYLNQHRDSLTDNEYRDGLYAIESAKMDMIQAQNQSIRQGRVTDVKMDMDSGAWDQLTVDQVSTKLNSLARIHKQIPSSSIYELKEYWRNRQYQGLQKKMDLSMAMEMVSNGIKPSDDQAKLLWDLDLNAHKDIRFFKDFISKVGARPFHFDYVKESIFSNNPQRFAQGIYYGMQLWFADPKKAKQYFDDDTLKAITWGYNELRTIDEQDQEIVINPDTGEAEKQPSAITNIANAYEKIHERLFPDKALIGVNTPSIPTDKVQAAADTMLDEVFYNPGTWSRRIPLGPFMDWGSTTIGAFMGGETAGIRAQAEYKTFWESISQIPYDAREFYKNLVEGKAMDQAAGGMVSPEKAAELAMPEFLNSWGVTRLGAKPGTAYWQFMAPEISIRKYFNQGSAEYTAAVQDFYTMVYNEVLDFTTNNPAYHELGFRDTQPNAGDWATIESKKIPPSIRLIPDYGSLGNDVPDYFIGYMTENGTYVNLESGGQPYVLKGKDIQDFLKKFSEGKLQEIRQ